MSAPSAASVSSYLHNQGVWVLPSGTPRTREGVRVQRSVVDTVMVWVDYDSPRHARQVFDAIVGILDASPRYAVARINACDEDNVFIIYVGSL